MLTLKQTKSMFEPGQRWEVSVRTGHHSYIGVLTFEKMQARDFVFQPDEGRRVFVGMPKASQLVEASEGYLHYTLHDGYAEVKLQQQPNPSL